MSASFFDLMKYARTGIASPSMTAYDKQKAQAMFGGKPQTLTGVPPLSFKANGKPLVSWDLLGNAQQTGTPSPDNIIMPTFCGVRTAQLFYARLASKNVAPNGCISNISGYDVLIAKVSPAQEYTASKCNGVYGFFDRPPQDGFVQAIDETRHTFSGDTMTFTAPAGCYYVAVRCKSDEEKPMLNLGSTALPYEPYGYKIPFTCAGQTVPVYLGQTQTVRKVKKLVLTGTETGWTYPSEGVARLTVTSASVKTTGTDNAPISTHYIGRFSDNNGSISFLTDATKLTIVDTVNAVDSTTWTTYLAAQYAAGTPVTVWYVLAEPETGIVNEPLAKIGDYADELHSTDAGVTIPTTKGNNTLTVDTDLQPSSMTITGHIE